MVYLSVHLDADVHSVILPPTTVVHLGKPSRTTYLASLVHKARNKRNYKLCGQRSVGKCHPKSPHILLSVLPVARKPTALKIVQLLAAVGAERIERTDR